MSEKLIEETIINEKNIDASLIKLSDHLMDAPKEIREAFHIISAALTLGFTVDGKCDENDFHRINTYLCEFCLELV